MLEQLRLLGPVDWLRAALDVAIVAYVLYRLLLLIRGTRAVQLIKGIIMLVVATSVSRYLRLDSVNWLLQQAGVMLVVALPIVFQPELRRALEQIGRGKFLARPLFFVEEEDVEGVVAEVIKAIRLMSRNRIGALLVLEREIGLTDYIEKGIRIEGVTTAELLVNIFVPNTPLHDGAVIIRGNRVMAAACFLPFTDSPGMSPELGGRHRAALGITEHSDALGVVVSEETGRIALANGGKLMRNLDEKTLQEMLLALMRPRPRGAGLFSGGWRDG